MENYVNIKNSESALVGLVLGIVWLIMGFSYDNSGIMMLGGIMLSFGLFYKLKKEPVKNELNDASMPIKKQTIIK